MNEVIDFVITWVDGSDKNWIAKKDKYVSLASNNTIDASNSRYRDWEFLKYWFRSVEKYANWVNKIYFITDNQIPAWLNTNNKKIVIINHEDILPSDALPTFNSNAIEMGIENIKNLSEKFVYFNDDMFINDYVDKSDFFVNGLPADAAILSPIIPKEKSGFYKAAANTVFVLNENYCLKKSIKYHKNKWFNFKYGIDNFRNIFLQHASGFCGFYNSHIPNSYLKSCFSKAIHLDEEMYYLTIKSKFRNNNNNIIHWIARYYQLVTGNFYPRSNKIGKYFSIENSIEDLIIDILDSKHKMLCINDNCSDADFETFKNELLKAFEQKYPYQSSFELNEHEDE
jgi:hypothetical protein